MFKKWLGCVLLLAVFAGAASLGTFAQTRTVRKSETESEDLKLLKPTGVTRISPSLNAIRISPGEYVVARVAKEAAVQQLTGEKRRITLPFRLYGISRSGAPLNLDVIVEDEGGMHFEEATNQFEGVLHVGIIDKDNPTSTQQSLPAAINLLIINDQGGIRPDGDLEISHTNLPFEEVIAYSVAPREPVNLRIRSSFAADPVEVILKVNRPLLGLTISPLAIKGYGLEAAEIIVRVEGLSRPEGKNVILETTRGGIEDPTIKLDSNGTARTAIRSVGVGETTITASMTGAENVSAQLIFIKPWMFFLIAIIGGMVGAVIFVLQEKITSGRKIAGRIILGILIAIVVAVGFAVGVNLVGVEPKAKVGEAVVFLLAAVGSWLGKLVIPSQS